MFGLNLLIEVIHIWHNDCLWLVDDKECFRLAIGPKGHGWQGTLNIATYLM